MRANEIKEVLRRQPFQPFRIRLSTGQKYEVRHPEFVALTKTSLFVGEPASNDDFPDQMIQCDLMHVVAVEPIEMTRSP